VNFDVIINTDRIVSRRYVQNNIREGYNMHMLHDILYYTI